MKNVRQVFSLLITLAVFSGNAEAQFLKKLKKKAKDAAEETILLKSEEKTEEKTDQAIETVFGIPQKIKKNKDNQTHNSIEGTWYYETLESVSGFEDLNECGKKSNISYIKNNYQVQFYDNDCNLVTNSGGTFTLKDSIMTIKAKAKNDVSTTKITTTQTILEHTQNV